MSSKKVMTPAEIEEKLAEMFGDRRKEEKSFLHIPSHKININQAIDIAVELYEISENKTVLQAGAYVGDASGIVYHDSCGETYCVFFGEKIDGPHKTRWGDMDEYHVLVIFYLRG